MSSMILPDGSIADPYQNYIALSRYARWKDEEGRRETWSETVDRYFAHMIEHLENNYQYTPEERLVSDLKEAVLHLDIVPSMRAIMTAGPALSRSGIASYNCSYLPLQDVYAFSELLYILMNGTGVGYSVERKYVEQLPPVPAISLRAIHTITVADSKEGWAEAFNELLKHLWAGYDVKWDLSLVRPEGARLKTFGGRASGPGPLDDLFKFTRDMFRRARGRKFKPIEVHDIACKVASVIVSGGVRRSAMISLSDLDDQEMANAKSGEWWNDHPHRALANISAVYSDGMTRDEFDQEWASLVASGSGERGIFNRDAAIRQATRWGRREVNDYGTNPCSEIILRPFGFCNLSEVIVNQHDNLQTLTKKVMLASVLGTWQSTITNFPYLRDEWRKNAEEERLLGVSLTGTFGNTMMVDNGRELESILNALRESARVANEREAGSIGIPTSASITCVKPSGTVSQLGGVSSGLHPWHSEYYIRSIREGKTNPIGILMKDSEVPHEDDLMNPTNDVFYFPRKAPVGSVTREGITAIDHLEMWLTYQRHYCEHKPSVTISVREEEWDEVGEWVWEHLDEISGVSFLPYSEHTYQQAPYQECSEEEYHAAAARFPDVYWGDLSFYEMRDETTGSQELACSANGCEIT